MDAADLASAMEGMRSLFLGTYSVTTEKRPEFTLRVEQTHPRCFILAFFAAATAVMAGPAATAIANTVGIVGAVFGVVFWLKGKRPEKTLSIPDGAEIVNSSGQIMKITPELAKLLEHDRAWEDLQKILAPLRKPGADYVVLLDENGKELARIKRNGIEFPPEKK